jgi:hypothetical protein
MYGSGAGDLPVRRTGGLGRATILMVAVSLIALVGCSHRGNPLDGTQWRLSNWTLSSLSPADFTITAKFADRQMSGSSGVNSYRGPYSLGGCPARRGKSTAVL